MLNTDYKILAKALASHLSIVLPSLFHTTQTGFVPKRFIGDTIKNIQILVDFTLDTGRSALIVSLDFKAAFDSINLTFLLRALETYRLGDTFMTWISTLYSGSKLW